MWEKFKSLFVKEKKPDLPAYCKITFRNKSDKEDELVLCVICPTPEDLDKKIKEFMEDYCLNEYTIWGVKISWYNWPD